MGLLNLSTLLTFGVVKHYEEQVKKFGKALKRIRVSKGYSQQRLADECDLDKKTILRLEKGESGTGLPAIFAISEVLGIKPQIIFDEMEVEKKI